MIWYLERAWHALLCLRGTRVPKNEYEILLKKKDTIQNRIVSKMYRKALMSKYFHASVTSYYYGELLKEWLCLDFNYTVIHDPFIMRNGKENVNR